VAARFMEADVLRSEAVVATLVLGMEVDVGEEVAAVVTSRCWVEAGTGTVVVLCLVLVGGTVGLWVLELVGGAAGSWVLELVVGAVGSWVLELVGGAAGSWVLELVGGAVGPWVLELVGGAVGPWVLEGWVAVKFDGFMVIVDESVRVEDVRFAMLNTLAVYVGLGLVVFTAIDEIAGLAVEVNGVAGGLKCPEEMSFSTTLKYMPDLSPLKTLFETASAKYPDGLGWSNSVFTRLMIALGNASPLFVNSSRLWLTSRLKMALTLPVV
jgi:hypothetical protein